jgi:hypothetical protein
MAFLGMLLLVPMLLWSELGGRSNITVFNNKVVAAGSFFPRSRCKIGKLLAGHGGGGERSQSAARFLFSSPLAGRGGEEVPEEKEPILDLGVEASLSCCCCSNSNGPCLPSVSSCHGGGEDVDGSAVAQLDLPQLLPTGCYGSWIPRAEHIASRFDAVIFGRCGGPISTSIMEASLSSAAEARRSLATKWFRPRWLDDGRWQKICAGREPSSFLLQFLGGDARRTPAVGGGETLGLDCFLVHLCRVFFVKCEPLFSNSRFFGRVMYKGLSVKSCTYHI